MSRLLSRCHAAVMTAWHAFKAEPCNRDKARALTEAIETYRAAEIIDACGPQPLLAMRRSTYTEPS